MKKKQTINIKALKHSVKLADAANKIDNGEFPISEMTESFEPTVISNAKDGALDALPSLLDWITRAHAFLVEYEGVGLDRLDRAEYAEYHDKVNALINQINFNKKPK